MKRKSLIIPLLIILSLALSCKKTVESQQKAFANNVKKANELILEYPSFAELIKEQIAAAEAVMAETAAITDEKAKIENIGLASSTLRTGFISNLDSIRSTIKSIKEKSVEARSMDMKYNEKLRIDQAISNGEESINSALEKIKTTVNNKTEAEALSGIVLSDLQAAENNISRAIDVVQDRIDEEKEAEEEKIKAEKAKEAKVEEKKAEENKLITCEYCDTENPASAENCKNCGAALKK